VSQLASERVEDDPAPGKRNLLALARPYFGLIMLATVLLTAAGVVAMFRMPSGIYPEVAFPRIAIIAQTSGLAVKDVELAITRPIENAVNAVLGVQRVRSKSIRGASEVNVDFVPGTDMVQALNDVRARMADVASQLPPGTSTLIERQTPSVFPIISFVVTGGRDPSALRDYAYYDLRPRVSRIPDVFLVTVEGGDVREIVVEVEPERLIAAGLSLTDVVDRLGKEHRLKAVGRMDREALQFQVLTNTQAAQPPDLEDRVLVERNGQPIRVCDVGRVIVSHEDHLTAIRANGKDAVVLTVFRRPGGSALAVSKELDEVLAAARKSAPPNVRIVPIHNEALLVRTAIDNVRDAILIGGAFSVLILLAFLKSIRATILAAVSIPLSLIISFVFIRLTGDTLNLMSLGGLAVAIGLIIDDSVVVVENITRHMAEGQTGERAIAAASREISGAVIGSTLTTILVFLPLAFVRGVVGQFFQSLSLALTIALLVSMVVSLTIVPVLAARFLARRRMPTTGPIYRILVHGYEGLLRVGLWAPRTTVLVALLAVLPGWWLAEHVKSDFMPDMDEGAFVLDYWMPIGASLQETDRALRKVEAVLLSTPDVKSYLRRTGSENGLFATEVHRGDILISLKPPGQRRRMGEIMKELEDQAKEAAPELKTVVSIPLIKDQINDLSGLEREIEVKVFGPDLGKLRKLAGRVAEIVQTTEGVKEANPHNELGNPDLVIRPDSVQTQRVGLNGSDVLSQVGAGLYGEVATTLPEQDRITNVRVRYPDSVRYDRQRLERLPISLPAAAPPANATPGTTSSPNFVLLDQLASIKVVPSPNELDRENLQPVITVTGELKSEDEDLGGVSDAIEAKLAKLPLPAGYRWEMAGERRAQRESFVSLLTVLVVAAGLVFLLLGFQFRSLTLPLLIFLTQPVSLASALLALYLTGTPLNVSSFMGAILLIGLDVKNGIILIEYIGQLHRGGLPLSEALVQAGRTRFRPILMTSLCTIFGLLPLAFGMGPGAQMQQPLAVAVIGGLIANMLLTRLLVPVGYLVIRGRAET
jgi:CzcA family heavy metal efflux pump